MAKKTLLVVAIITLVLAFSIRTWVEYTPSPYSGVLIVNTDTGQGSCFVVAQHNGWWYAITAGHVTESYGYEQTVTVDYELYEAEVVRESYNEDVALIRFQSPENYRVYSFADAVVGEACTTVGFSGSKLTYKGHVVSTNFRGYVVANGGVLPGCSGGALLNERNEIIGVTVAVPIYSFGAMDSSALYVPARFAEAMVTTIGD